MDMENLRIMNKPRHSKSRKTVLQWRIYCDCRYGLGIPYDPRNLHAYCSWEVIAGSNKACKSKTLDPVSHPSQSWRPCPLCQIWGICFLSCWGWSEEGFIKWCTGGPFAGRNRKYSILIDGWIWSFCPPEANLLFNALCCMFEMEAITSAKDRYPPVMRRIRSFEEWVMLLWLKARDLYSDCTVGKLHNAFHQCYSSVSICRIMDF